MYSIPPALLEDDCSELTTERASDQLFDAEALMATGLDTEEA